MLRMHANEPRGSVKFVSSPNTIEHCAVALATVAMNSTTQKDFVRIVCIHAGSNYFISGIL